MQHTRMAWSGWLIAALLVLAGWGIRHDGNGDTRAADEAAIDAVYDRLSQAYATLDTLAVLDLYTDDAYYLMGTAQRLLHGKKDLGLAYSALERRKEKGIQLTLEFSIVERVLEGDLAYDVGYYKLTTTRPDGNAKDTAAKFVAVLQKQDDGSWRFRVNSESQAWMPAFEQSRAE